MIQKIRWDVLAWCLIAGTASFCITAWANEVDLGAPRCEVVWDSQQVPHIHASQLSDGWYCWGKLHARERGFQMDLMRRTAQGRRAEILGYTSIQTDFMMRLLGLEAQGKRIYDGLTPRGKELLQNYARGANAAWDEARRLGKWGYEFEELGYTPEPWLPEQSLALMMLQSFDQTRKGFEQDFKEQAWIERYGLEETKRLFSDHEVPWGSTVLHEGEYPKRTAHSEQKHTATSSSARSDQWTDPYAFLGNPEGQGSNNWVISAKNSKTGNAWLANDPHLGMKHPPFWALAHLSFGADLDVMGVSLPGVPLIASGANRNVAWGLTNAYLDVADVTSLPRNELKGIHSERPTIWVRLARGLKVPFVFKSFERTEEGYPILPVMEKKGRVNVLRWTGYEISAEHWEATVSLMAAKSAKEMDQVVDQVKVPSWNFVFADQKGAVGYRASGRVPARTSEPAWGVPEQSVADWKAAPEWSRRLSTEEMPHALNPARGWVQTANHRHWPEDAQFFGGRAYAESFRGARIDEYFGSQKKWDWDLIRAAQCDWKAMDAPTLWPLIRSAWKIKTQHQSRIAAVFAGWEQSGFTANADCEACPIYRRGVDLVLEKTGLREEGLWRKLKEGQLHAEVQEAFDRALEQIPSGTKWGKLHTIHFPHWMGDDAFRVEKGLSVGGDKNTVNPGTMTWKKDHYEMTDGASQRLIVEMGNPIRMYSVLSGPLRDERVLNLEQGTDGNKTVWAKWRDCDYEKRQFPVENWDDLRKSSIKTEKF